MAGTLRHGLTRQPRLDAPEQDALERVEVRRRVADGLAAGARRYSSTNGSCSSAGQHAREAGERRALDPLDDVGRARQDVAVDLQAHVLAGGAEVVEQDGVLLGRQDVGGDRVGAAARRPSPSGTARSPPTSAATRCDGWSALAGTCTASWPPGASAAHQRARTAGWSGTHCRLALASTRSWSPSDVHDADVALLERAGPAGRARRRPASPATSRCRPSSSMPSRSASAGRQLTGAAAEVDGAPDRPVARRSATRSQNGCARSAANLPYCAGSQASAHHPSVSCGASAARTTLPGATQTLGWRQSRSAGRGRRRRART